MATAFLIAVIVVAVVVWFFLNRPTRDIAIVPAVPGLGTHFGMTVHVLRPPLHLEGNKFVSGEYQPDWLPSVAALLSPEDLSWEAFNEYASKEYISAYQITPQLLESAKKSEIKRKPKVSIPYFASVEADSGQFIIVAEVIGAFVDRVPSDTSNVGAILLKKEGPHWKQYPLAQAQGIKAIPWNDLERLEKIIATKKAVMAPTGKLHPDQ